MFFFHEEDLLAPGPPSKLEDYTLSSVGHCLFNLFAATLHIGGRSSIRNLRTRRTVDDRDTQTLLSQRLVSKNKLKLLIKRGGFIVPLLTSILFCVIGAIINNNST